MATLLLEEAFGEIVAKVGGYLIKHGDKALSDVLKGVNLEKEQVALLTEHVLN